MSQGSLNASRKIVFVNRFFFPDISATSQILSDVAFALASEDFSVTVVTSSSLYERSGKLPEQEVIAGVNVIRVKTPTIRSTSLLARAMTFAAFYITAGIALLRQVKNGDILVVKTDPPLFLFIAAMIARLRNAQQVNWLQDLYPEVAAQLGVGLAQGKIGRLLSAARDRILASAATNVVIGERMADLLRRRGIEDARISIIPNWSDDDAIVPQLDIAPQRLTWGLTDKCVIGYSGNIGKAHEIETLLDVAEHYRNDDNVRFLFIGGGALRTLIENRSLQLGLPNIVWQPYQPREDLPQTLAVPDIHWLSLAPSLEGLIVPSKLYGILAAGKPFVFVGAEDGEVARVARRYDCGWTVRPGDAAGFITAIERFRSDPVAAHAMGMRGRAAIDADLGRAKALRAWSTLLRRLSDREVRAV
jgi:colanic acid biosynthesis glycosyl transferase WcaI